MENYQNLVGKLLAGENITILQKRMKTSVFDIKNRTLYLPIWKDITPEINDILICHEVSHALFTPMDYVDALETRLKFRNAKSYLNILEDVRVEKLIKRRYPGIKKSFAIGYKQLNDKDFFGVAEKDLSACHLMDKINLYYKVGFSCGVTFTEKEKVFVDRASTTETIHDVIQLAEDIFNFLHEESVDPTDNPKPNKTKVKADSSEDEEESVSEPAEAEESSEEGSSEEESEESLEEGSGEESEEGSESTDAGGSGASRLEDVEESLSTDIQDFEDEDIVTDSAFSQNAKSIVDMSEEREYLEIQDSKSKRIIPYSAILNSFNYALRECSANYINNFKDNATDAVNYLVKEFEMKKAATSYKNNTIAKSGIIDIKKLYAYQIKDDLFRRISITKDGKNHGMIILIDWSGSMRYVIKHVLQQAITLAMFCRRVNIPFQILAFANSILPSEWKQYVNKNYDREDRSIISENHNRYFLMELFSDKMNNNDMKRMIDFTLSNGLNSVCPLNCTPLTESLIYMYSHISGFISKNNIEKFTFITLTDGQGSPFGRYYSVGYDDNHRKVNKRYFIKTTTGNMIEFDDDTASQTNGVLKAIKERYKCNVVGFYIGSTNGRELNSFILSAYGDDFYYSGNSDTIKTNIRKDCNKDGLCCIRDITGYDIMFFVPSKNMKIEDDELTINPNDNAKKIAKDFSKHLTKKKNSRVLLNEFTKIIA